MFALAKVIANIAARMVTFFSILGYRAFLAARLALRFAKKPIGRLLPGIGGFVSGLSGQKRKGSSLEEPLWCLLDTRLLPEPSY